MPMMTGKFDRIASYAAALRGLATLAFAGGSGDNAPPFQPEFAKEWPSAASKWMQRSMLKRYS